MEGLKIDVQFFYDGVFSLQLEHRTDGKPKTTQLHIVQMYTDENTLFFEWINIKFCFCWKNKNERNQDFKIPFKLRTKIWKFGIICWMRERERGAIVINFILKRQKILVCLMVVHTPPKKSRNNNTLHIQIS